MTNPATILETELDVYLHKEFEDEPKKDKSRIFECNKNNCIMLELPSLNGRYIQLEKDKLIAEIRNIKIEEDKKSLCISFSDTNPEPLELIQDFFDNYFRFESYVAGGNE